MTPARELRRRAILAKIAAELEDRRAEQAIKKSFLAEYGCLSLPTVYRALNGCNVKVSTLVDIADALDCDVKVTIEKRSA